MAAAEQSLGESGELEPLVVATPIVVFCFILICCLGPCRRKTIKDKGGNGLGRINNKQFPLQLEMLQGKTGGSKNSLGTGIADVNCVNQIDGQQCEEFKKTKLFEDDTTSIMSDRLRRMLSQVLSIDSECNFEETFYKSRSLGEADSVISDKLPPQLVLVQDDNSGNILKNIEEKSSETTHKTSDCTETKL